MVIKLRHPEPNKITIESNHNPQAFYKQKHLKKVNYELTDNGVYGSYKKNSWRHFEENTFKIKPGYFVNYHKKSRFRASKYRAVN